MTADDVLARGEELRQQGVADGGGLWASAEYVDWLVEHGEALMRVARMAQAMWHPEDDGGFSVRRFDVDSLRAALDSLGVATVVVTVRNTNCGHVADQFGNCPQCAEDPL